MLPTIMMLIGGLLWLAGELWGVRRKERMDTTSDYVWWLEARIPIVRVLVGIFVLSLFGHFMWHGGLLP